MTLRKQYYPRNKVKIDPVLCNCLMDAAKAAYPEEACGVLFGASENLSVHAFEGVKNHVGRGQTYRFFQVDPMELYRLERRAQGEEKEIIGFYHSHPDAAAIPSEEDIRYMVPGMLYLILSVMRGKAGDGRIYRKNLDESVEELQCLSTEEDKES